MVVSTRAFVAGAPVLPDGATADVATPPPPSLAAWLGGADSGSGTQEYERRRDERIRENLERMHKLGITDLALKFRSSISGRSPARKRPYSKRAATPSPALPPRRSSRLQNSAPVSYCEIKKNSDEVPQKKKRLPSEEGPVEEVYTDEHEKLLGTCETHWTLFVDGYGRGGRRIYDQVKGKTCHQCRQKTLGHRTSCSKCNLVQGQFCGDCLYMRYGENVLEANINPNWICPVCRGICNCSICRTKKGWAPTGILYKRILKLGFKSVAHFLIQTKRVQTNTECSGPIHPISAKRSLPFTDQIAQLQSNCDYSGDEACNKKLAAKDTESLDQCDGDEEGKDGECSDDSGMQNSEKCGGNKSVGKRRNEVALPSTDEVAQLQTSNCDYSGDETCNKKLAAKDTESLDECDGDEEGKDGECSDDSGMQNSEKCSGNINVGKRWNEVSLLSTDEIAQLQTSNRDYSGDETCNKKLAAKDTESLDECDGDVEGIVGECGDDSVMQNLEKCGGNVSVGRRLNEVSLPSTDEVAQLQTSNCDYSGDETCYKKLAAKDIEGLDECDGDEEGKDGECSDDLGMQNSEKCGGNISAGKRRNEVQSVRLAKFIADDDSGMQNSEKCGGNISLGKRRNEVQSVCLAESIADRLRSCGNRCESRETQNGAVASASKGLERRGKKQLFLTATLRCDSVAGRLRSAKRIENNGTEVSGANNSRTKKESSPALTVKLNMDCIVARLRRKRFSVI